jgi:hypothetical protein
MFKLKLITLAVCVLAFFGASAFLVLPAQPVAADTVTIKIPAGALPQVEGTGPNKVKVGIYVLNLGIFICHLHPIIQVIPANLSLRMGGRLQPINQSMSLPPSFTGFKRP